ncbi:MAG: 3-methyl-2-oxobutanoate hydroxymethyltransferase [Chrysiogenales bacterium]|nr:3-methyl-2-oxobutanoate hydroxymethyltransferase [Candidatus Aminicenantes bacterium]TFG80630.1 MAG: 3-methyl-2-oxobutanoate hydroxymethyltransferase [Chrysiogenales bacterium]
MPQPDLEKKTVLTLGQKKARGEKITAVTAYDYPTASLASLAGIDLILVGDSLGMVLQGHENTLKVTMDEMVYHTSLVARARPRSLVVSDMPYQSFHINSEKSLENACRCVKEGGAEAVKLEGGRKRFKVIEAMLNAEIPVLAHLGLTPQSVHQLGGFKVQGKLQEKAREIFQDALALEKLGVFAIVLESIPQELAKKITDSVSIPTIGIGAGRFCDGQVLVFPDLVGFTNISQPKFVRKYADTHFLWLQALQKYISDVQHGDFPNEEESYHLKLDIEEFLK